MKNTTKNVCVIGGGAAGLMAAYAAAENGHAVTVFEQNEKLGKKIYITGKGRCNFTNDCALDEFFPNVVRGERFLKGCLYSFTPQDTIQFFENNGLSVKIERGNRAFPQSDHASDVTKTLEKACKNVGVTVKLEEKVTNLLCATPDIIPMSNIEQGCTPDIITMPRIVGLRTEKGEYACDVVIVATGGLSYPSTGSTGDGYAFAKKVGHTIVDTKCALCGLNTLHGEYTDLQGLTLKNVKIAAKYGQKTVFEDFGELLFTHFGVSGPIVLSLSSKINRLPLSSVEIFVDLKPALDEQTLDKRLLRDFEKYKNKQIANALMELLPQKLICEVLSRAQITPQTSVHSLTKAQRQSLLRTIKALPIKVTSLRGYNEAIITSGGVELSQINPKTMESKLVSGLKFCGEVLDVDAFTGGFNLQIAFSTAYAAGKTIK